jgi:hypothetical protein
VHQALREADALLGGATPGVFERGCNSSCILAGDCGRVEADEEHAGHGAEVIRCYAN